jgi:hypothetical protein
MSMQYPHSDVCIIRFKTQIPTLTAVVGSISNLERSVSAANITVIESNNEDVIQLYAIGYVKKHQLIATPLLIDSIASLLA